MVFAIIEIVKFREQSSFRGSLYINLRSLQLQHHITTQYIVILEDPNTYNLI